jgi:heme oxygenase
MAPVKDVTEASGDLRSHLRAATMAAHDLLDAAMQAASGWQIREDYARFLELQHAARAPLEDWLAAHAPADLHPPRQTALIAQDLAALGRPVPPPAPAFALETPSGSPDTRSAMTCRVLPRPMSSARIARWRESRNATPEVWWR